MKFKNNLLNFILIFASISIACTVSSITPTPIPTQITNTEILIVNTQTNSPTITNDLKESQIGIVIDCTALNLRKLPSENSQIIDTIPVFDEIEVLSIDGDWYEVTWKGKLGFVYSKYIKIK